MSNNFKKINPTLNKIQTTRDVKNKNLYINTNSLRYTYGTDDKNDNYIKSFNNTYGNILLPSKNDNNSLLFNTENKNDNKTLLSSQSYKHLFNSNNRNYLLGTPRRNDNINNQNKYTLTFEGNNKKIDEKEEYIKENKKLKENNTKLNKEKDELNKIIIQ